MQDNPPWLSIIILSASQEGQLTTGFFLWCIRKHSTLKQREMVPQVFHDGSKQGMFHSVWALEPTLSYRGHFIILFSSLYTSKIWGLLVDFFYVAPNLSPHFTDPWKDCKIHETFLLKHTSFNIFEKEFKRVEQKGLTICCNQNQERCLWHHFLD